ncbi:MAG: tRNA 2-selenouridine(34) synthase MnmH [Cryomorphaceae bacterium]|nr:tRNA 2-selenouridine(34) synthase MnmH [Cryomorphaceae bacterium]
MDEAIKTFLEKAENGVLLDVRSPAEFSVSHIPGAISFPLFSDDERAKVGTAYKAVGQQYAFDLGIEFVGPKLVNFVREARSLTNGKPIFMYCWRGGMRSSSMAWLLRSAGMQVDLLPGGYKAFRRLVVDDLARVQNLLVLGGMTGAGKTEVLRELHEKGVQVIDLEGIANHKGSAFGNLMDEEQPTSEMFNNIVWKLVTNFSSSKPIWLEDESRSIGTVYILEDFYQQMIKAPFVIIEKDRSERAEKLAREYGALTPELLKYGFEKIRKRLGGQHVNSAVEAIENGDLKSAAEVGLAYYDKAYSHTISKRLNDNTTTINANGMPVSEISEMLLKNETDLWKKKFD